MELIELKLNSTSVQRYLFKIIVLKGSDTILDFDCERERAGSRSKLTCNGRYLNDIMPGIDKQINERL